MKIEVQVVEVQIVIESDGQDTKAVENINLLERRWIRD
jgi:hypothetical protein